MKKVVFSFVLFLWANLFCLGAQVIKLDAPKVDPPKLEVPAADDKKAEKVKAEFNKVLAFLPFNKSSAISSNVLTIVNNEILAAFVKNPNFTSLSAKMWMDINYNEKKFKNFYAIKNSISKIPADYLCNGYVCKIAECYGVLLTATSTKGDNNNEYVFRKFTSLNDLSAISEQVVDEFVLRIKNKQQKLFKKNIYIKDFDIKLSQYDTGLNNRELKLILPLIKFKDYEINDKSFFIEKLLLHKFQIGSLFNVWGNNAYQWMANTASDIQTDYVIEGDIDIALDYSIINIYVKDSRDKLIYTNSYRVGKFNYNNFNAVTFDIVYDITSSLLSPDEKQLTADVSVDSFFKDQHIFINNCYADTGYMKKVIVPDSLYFYQTTFDFKDMENEKINLSSFTPRFVDHPYFMYHVGGDVSVGVTFNEKFNKDITTELSSCEFALSDAYSVVNKSETYNLEPGAFGGASLTGGFETKYFDLTGAVSLYLSEYFRNFTVNANSVTVNGYDLSNLKSEYFINKYSVIPSLHILPSVLFLPVNSKLRGYAGVGIFASLWYTSYEEEYIGSVIFDDIAYTFDAHNTGNQTLTLSSGIFPELGFYYKINKFRINWGVAYFADIINRRVYSNSNEYGYSNDNMSYVVLKFGLSYYIKK